MDIEQLLGGMLRGAIGGRRKPHSKALRYLTGRKRGFLTPARMVGIAGLVWGVVETVMAQSGSGQAPPAGPAPWPGGAPNSSAATPRGVMGGAGGTAPVVPPPLPTAPPPLAASGAPAPSTPPAAPLVDPAASGPLGRIIRLTISAARADGTLSDQERTSIVAQARLVGLESLVEAELATPTAVEDIVSGFGDAAAARDLYTMAFTIVRADADVDAGERAYLVRLAAALGLDAEAAAAIERETATEIEAQDG